jgi:methylmalonyl-CoA mutase C-terminal domain/subunit
MIVSAALQEDVDAVGLSVLSGAHNYLFPKVLELLKQEGADDIVVFGGGIIPEDDIPKLKDVGVGEIFLPGDGSDRIVSWINENVKPRM